VSESLLTILKLCLLALLYLFFFRVVRAVWAEIKAPPPTELQASGRKARKQAKKATKAKKTATQRARSVLPAGSSGQQLVIVEPATDRGRSYDVGGGLTMGRAATCQILVDDTYVSQLHARVYARDGQLLVEDLGSTNGTYLNRQRVQGPMVMKRGDRVQVGNTVLELT
jgi:pSer/pThr/pTyr-binding forkhead associated (FHA) protein